MFICNRWRCMEFDRKGLKISERVDQSMSGIEVEHRFVQWGANLIQPPKQLQRFYILHC